MRALDPIDKPQTTGLSPVPRTAPGAGLMNKVQRQPELRGRSLDALPLTRAGDKHEREADQAAERVMNNQPATDLLPDRGQDHSTPGATASGKPLDPGTRTLMEARLGHDFSHVRVHTDAQAAASAQNVNARAYTVGSDIVFGKGQYHPSTDASQRLIAHELAHVVQQRKTGQQVVARQLEYERTGRSIPRANMEKPIGFSYWEAKLDDTYTLIYGTDRLKKDPEERDAVLSVVWAKQPPAQFTTQQVMEVYIPARASTPIGKPLLYKFTFDPKDATNPHSKPSVRVDFENEGMGTVPVTPSTKTPSDFSSSVRSYSHSGFPGGDAYQYFEQHEEETKSLFHWIEKEAPAKFDQLLKIQTTTKKKKVTTTTETTFHVSGEKDKRGAVQGLSIQYIGNFNPAVQAVPKDYRSRDYADLMVERAQANPDKVMNDKLGKVDIPTGLSAEERFAVNYYVVRYFEGYMRDGKPTATRNAEVDAIVLIPNKPTKVLYTFRFGTNNDVQVERVGEVGADAKAGQKDPDKADIARAPEFADKAQDPKTFAAWLKVRYPKVTVAGSTVEDMRTDINAKADAGASTPEWYKNYDIKVLNEADGKKRLQFAHLYKKPQVEDVKDFKPAELRILELALETMARKVLDILKFVRMIRQRISIEPQPDKTFAENPKWAGLQLSNGSERSVLIFDSTFNGDPTQFLGGSQGVLPEPAETFAHELGHAFDTATVQKKFEAFVAKNNIKPFTKYAKDSVAEGKPKEFFAEAFALFQVDPEYMKTNYPALHAWFETLSKTGSPPK